MRRLSFLAVFCLAAVPGQALSSSIVKHEASEPVGTPSIVAIGDADRHPSIVAVEGIEPPVSDEHVAAIEDQPKPRPRRAATAPMVIRGGIVGGSHAVAVASSRPAQQPAAAGHEEAGEELDDTSRYAPDETVNAPASQPR